MTRSGKPGRANRVRQPPVRSRPTGRFPWASPFAWGMQEFGLGENVWMAFLGRSSLGRPYRARLCSIAPNYSKDWFYFLSKSAKLHGPRIGIWKASKNESRFETGDAFRPRSFRSSIYRQRSPCLTGWRAGQPSSSAYCQGRLLLWRMRRACVYPPALLARLRRLRQGLLARASVRLRWMRPQPVLQPLSLGLLSPPMAA